MALVFFISLFSGNLMGVVFLHMVTVTVLCVPMSISPRNVVLFFPGCIMPVDSTASCSCEANL
jgi:hypothetical protein